MLETSSASVCGSIKKIKKVCKEMLCKEQHASSTETTGACVPVKQIDTGYFLFAFCFTTCA